MRHLDKTTAEYVDVKNASAITGLSKSWLDKARVQRSDGPPYIAVTPRKVLYKVADLHAWLAERQRTCTAA